MKQVSYHKVLCDILVCNSTSCKGLSCNRIITCYKGIVSCSYTRLSCARLSCSSLLCKTPYCSIIQLSQQPNHVPGYRVKTDYPHPRTSTYQSIIYNVPDYHVKTSHAASHYIRDYHVASYYEGCYHVFAAVVACVHLYEASEA